MEKGKKFRGDQEWVAAFGRRCREVREMAKLNQTEVAAAIGLASPTAIMQIEKGRIAAVNLAFLQLITKLADQQGRQAGWLLDEPGQLGVVENIRLRMAELQALLNKGAGLPERFLAIPPRLPGEERRRR